MSKMIADRYMIVTSLGEGGMADVYLAMDTILNREVAVKVLRGELSKDPVALLRFLREASAVSKLQHPNVVEVYDVGEYDGKNFIVMEYIRGRTLKQLILQRGALQKEEAVEIMKQLVSAVYHAHEKNIIHRDIKPQNVLVKDDGTVKITDFGIALAHDAIQLTQSDAVLGSAHYIAPETTKGEASTVQIDIYALGIVFYELLTGDTPYKGDNPIQIAMKHLREDIPSVCEFNPTLPQSIENIVIKATAKNRLRRYASAKDMLFDLEMCLLPEFANVDKVDIDYEEGNTGTVILNKISDLAEEDETNSLTDRKDTTIKKDKKVVKKTVKKKKDNKKKLIIIAIVAVLAVTGVITGLYLNGNFTEEEVIEYTHMPDLENLTVEEAKEALKKSKLKLDKDIEEEVTDDVEEGLIIEQSITKKKKIKVGTKVKITISSGTYFVVKDYVGWAYSEAKAVIEAESKIQIVLEERETNDYLEGTILQQSLLSAGDKVDPNSTKKIKFVIAKTKKAEEIKEEFKVQNYIGKDVKYVQGLLEAKGIKVILDGTELSKEEMEESKITPNVVTAQNPEEGSTFTLPGNYTVTLKYYYEKK